MNLYYYPCYYYNCYYYIINSIILIDLEDIINLIVLYMHSTTLMYRYDKNVGFGHRLRFNHDKADAMNSGYE